jgi:glycosyltransferase involved in cell wall biosynthesis
MSIMSFMKKSPIISVVVVVYNMEREARRTLWSLTTVFQRDVCEEDYEVIVVDNGSTAPLSDELVRGFGKNFSYFFLNTTSKSPAHAVNLGVDRARGKFVGCIIDGARIVSPGIIRYALAGMKLYPNPVVATLAWHLGPDAQYRSVSRGYTKETEDALLESIDWVNNGYRLFEISSFAGSSEDGFFLPIAESNCFFLSREAFDQLGGFEERFKSSGGGLVNLDMYKRACELPKSNLIILLGEGTFHQVHGGVSTNVSEEENLKKWHEFEKEYIEIRKTKYTRPGNVPEYIGHVRSEIFRFVESSVQKAISR